MGKVVISNKIYLKVSKQEMADLASLLTYKIASKPNKNPRFNKVEVIRNYSIVSDTIIAIPKGREDLIPEGSEIIDNTISTECTLPYPLIPLRPAQQPVLDAWEGSGILNAKVGWGKSYTALWIAFKLGKKTLIVAHNTMLRDQWANDIEAMFGIRCGIVGSGKFNIDSPIVVGNIQTLVKHANALSAEFGTIIVDEMHHTSATTFSSFVSASKAKYRVGLSGTIKRADGKHIVFKDYFGGYIAQPPESDTMTPVVKILKAPFRLDPSVTYVEKINKLMLDEDYMIFIADIARIQINKGHKVLIVGDRVDFLDKIAEYMGKDVISITGGNSDLEARDLAKKMIETSRINAIAGSRQIFSEGISVNILSSIILSCPITNEILLEQLIGRIQRLYPGKLIPEVIDVNFASMAERQQNNGRMAFYLEKGWSTSILT